MEAQTVKDFRVQNTSRKGKLGKVRGSFGVYDAYKLIRRNGWYNIGKPLSEHEFYSIVRKVNKLLADNLSNGESLKFPERMGLLELRKYEKTVGFVNGKLRTNRPVNWEKTWELWFNDEEARSKGLVVRYDDEFLFAMRYNKFNANYENKVFYQFALNSSVKKNLHNNIVSGKVDTLW